MKRIEIIDVRKGAVVSVAYWDRKAKRLDYQTAHLTSEQAVILKDELLANQDESGNLFTGTLGYKFTK